MPRSFLAIFAGVLAAALGLAWLASRSLGSQRLLLERAAEDDSRREATVAAEVWRSELKRATAPFLESLGGVSASSLGPALDALQSRPGVTAAFALDRQGRFAWPPHPAPSAPWVEEFPADNEAREAMKRGYRLEIELEDLVRATQEYAFATELRFGRSVRAEAYIQGAAVLARLDKIPEALAAYASALTLERFIEPETALLARVGRARLLLKAKRDLEAEAAALSLAEAVWGEDEGKLGGLLESARSRAAALLAAAPESEDGKARRAALATKIATRRSQDEARAAADSVLPALLSRSSPPEFVALHGRFLVVWKTVGTMKAGVILRVDALNLGGATSLSGPDGAWSGQVPSPGISAPVPGAEGLTATLAPSMEASAYARRQEIVFACGLVLLLVVLAAGLWGSFRAVRKEAELARLKSDFVASVSHELKTPLALVRMYAETLALGRVTEPKQTQEYLEVILRESERLTGMMERILDFARLDGGSKKYEAQSGDIAAAARAVATDFSARTGTPVAVDAPLPVRATFDAEAISLAIRNLLENASKYSEGPPKINLRASELNGHAVLTVEDRGIGVPEGDRKRIFERFVRSDDPKARKVKGTGLGLALVAHIVEEHGGTVRCEGRDGGGTRFVMEFPRIAN